MINPREWIVLIGACCVLGLVKSIDPTIPWLIVAAPLWAGTIFLVFALVFAAICDLIVESWNRLTRRWRRKTMTIHSFRPRR
jgi:hypothetical protein